jgi:DNA-binding transcriptional regulator/RsmH inhibitor MraZ
MTAETGISGADQIRSRHYTSVDLKSRVPMQQSFRQRFGASVIGVMEQGGLSILNTDEYEVVARHVLRSTSFDTPDTAQRFFDQRLREWRESFFANSLEMTFDNQGRLTLPKKFREALDMPLESEVVWMAAGGYVKLRRAADVQAIDCAQRAGATGKPTQTVAPPLSPSAPNGSLGGDGGGQG